MKISNTLAGAALFTLILTSIARIAILGLGFMFFAGIIAQVIGTEQQPPKYDEAQYAIQSYTIVEDHKRPSRIYFTNDIEYINNQPVVHEYWWLDGEKYRKVEDDRVFTEPIKIVRRTQ